MQLEAISGLNRALIAQLMGKRRRVQKHKRTQDPHAADIIWRTKRRHLSSETPRRVGLEFVCVFGHDGYFKKAEFWHRTGTGWRRIPTNGAI